MKRFCRKFIALVVLLLVSAASHLWAAQPKLNVLFFAVDDLRPQLGCYGVADIKSPNIDKLASQGLLFTRAYCQQAVCSPSRTSLLTGRRPDTTRIFNLQDHFRDTIPDVVTLPQHFKNNGWFCQSFGKIFHGGLDDPKSWSAPSIGSGVTAKVLREDGTVELVLTDPDNLVEGEVGSEQHSLIDAPHAPYLSALNAPCVGAGLSIVHRDETLAGLTSRDPDNLAAAGVGVALDHKLLAAASSGEKKGAGKKMKSSSGPKNRPPWSSPDVPDHELGDGKMADAAIEVMRSVKDKPFFLAVGFRKPHLSFDAPKHYYDGYRTADMRLASNPFPPKDVFAPALSDWGELRAYTGIPKQGPVPDDMARQLIHGYYAATSYTDAQIGRVIAELEQLGLRERTIIVLWGDHGWQLGDHGMWCKHTCFETSTHSLLMVSAPGMKARGLKTGALAEFVDIYPSLCELAGLPLTDGLEGASFAPLLSEPQRPWKTAAFSQYPRGPLMGYAMRTDRYRYVEWVEHPANKNAKPLATWPAPAGRELYDHQTDPDENANLAARPEQAGLVKKLSEQLHAGWKAALPSK